MYKVIIDRYSNDYEESILTFMKKMQEQDFLNIKKKEVVIKPNLCHYTSPDSGVTTDVNFVRIVIDFIDENYNIDQFIIIESENWDRSLEEAYDRLGYYDLEKNHAKVRVVNLTKEPNFKIDIPNTPFEMDVPELFLNDFFYISIANLKTHNYMGMTGILKNNHGVFPAQIKNHLHPYLRPVEHLYYKIFHPDLGIIDGRIGLHNPGPTIGEPIQTNVLIGGDNAIAVDTVAARIMGLNPSRLPQLKYFYGKEKFDPALIKINGEEPSFNFNSGEKWRTKMIFQKMFITRGTDKLERKLKDLIFLYHRAPRYLLERIRRG